MAGEMQPGEYESAYIGFAAIQPRRTPPHSEGELWRRGGRGGGEGAGRGGRCEESLEVSTDVRSRCLRCSIATNPNMHYPFPGLPHPATQTGASSRSSELQLGERERPIVNTCTPHSGGAPQSGAPRSEVSHGRAAAAVPRAELSFKGASSHAWVRLGEGRRARHMTEGGVRRESSGGADSSRRVGSVGGAASGGRTLLRDALRRLGRRRAHLFRRDAAEVREWLLAFEAEGLEHEHVLVEGGVGRGEQLVACED
mmetsp:Transcript_6625/g.21220  ORF Transcript_6625/g.21220 Transcript_6625/m.21220 type:complete len:255 (-) Transcript_6625:998-1762(-)